ncbi:MAG: HAD-IB family phosphatase [Bacteroidia bacterium]|nr:HAD-IB family phosphatase [Bacteroidia bacterium]
MSSVKTFFIIDFDSTFTQVEAMEELAIISLKNDPEKELLIEKIKQLTDLAMEGKMPFGKSLKARITLLSAKKYHLNMLVNRLRKRVSTSFARNKQFFKDYKGQIYIISGGFKEFIIPVVKSYYIDESRVFANTFVYDKKNNIIGADETNPLSEELGKVKLLKQLKLQGNVIVIGDGYTDYQIYEAGLANQFFAFTENVLRESVVNRATLIAPSLDEILYTQRLPMALSYPKSRIKVLLYGEPTFLAEKTLKREGYQISKISVKASAKLLNQHLQESNILVFSPEVKIDLLENAKTTKLLTAAVWGEWDQTELAAKWMQKGIPVFSSRIAHTRSIVELALLMILELNRNRAEELVGKKMGIIGYGHIGSMLSVLAAHLGVDVFYYDEDDLHTTGNAKRIKYLPDLIKKVNMVVITDSNCIDKRPVLGVKEIKSLTAGSILINLSYDYSVDLKTVKQLLDSKKLAGFGMDCLKPETYNLICNWPSSMIYLQNRLATHQTQQNISDILSEKLLSFINSGSTRGSNNFPELSLPALQQSNRLIHVHFNKAGVLAQINNILANYKINIIGQYLKTNEHVGYVITDVSKEYPKRAIEDLKSIKETIRFRVLY